MKIGRFFLDVRGTITCNDKYNVENEKKRAISLLIRLIQKDELDEIRISIVSSETIEFVEEYGIILDELLSNIPKVHMGYHHAEGIMMHIGGPKRKDGNCKCDQMLQNLGVCEHSVCYYAEDNNINRIIAEHVIKSTYPNLKFVLFDPKEFELHGLNNAVEEYLNKK